MDVWKIVVGDAEYTVTCEVAATVLAESLLAKYGLVRIFPPASYGPAMTLPG